MSRTREEPRLTMARLVQVGTFLVRLDYLGVIALLAILIAYFSVTNPQFLTTSNAIALLSAVAVLGVVSIGQALVLIGGGFDLSVGGTVALGGIAYVMVSNQGVPPVAALLLVVLVVALVVGGVNGIAITRLGINPLITTLATLSITGGVAFSLVNGLALPLQNVDAAFLGARTFAGIPNYLWLLIVLYGAAAALLNRTTVGRSVYVVGGNPEAARLAGIRVNVLTVGLYMLSAGLAALAGVITASQLLAGSPSAGASTTLLSVTAVILGGGSLAGGRGTALGTLLGVLVLGTLSSGMAVNAVPTFYRDIVTGAVLLLAVGVGSFRDRLIFKS